MLLMVVIMMMLLMMVLMMMMLMLLMMPATEVGSSRWVCGEKAEKHCSHLDWDVWKPWSWSAWGGGMWWWWWPAAVVLSPVTRVRTTMPRANIRFRFRNGIRLDITWWWYSGTTNKYFEGRQPILQSITLCPPLKLLFICSAVWEAFAQTRGLTGSGKAKHGLVWLVCWFVVNLSKRLLSPYLLIGHSENFDAGDWIWVSG